MKYNERVQKWNETMRKTNMDADEGDGHWVTTKEGNHMFINGEGVPTKGNPHVLAAAKGEAKTKVSSGGKPFDMSNRKVTGTVGKISDPESKYTPPKSDRENSSLYLANGSNATEEDMIDALAYLHGKSASSEKVSLRNGDYTKAEIQRALNYHSTKGLPQREREELYAQLNREAGVEKKSGSSAKTYSVQDDKAKTTEFNKAMRESGEDAAAEILDTLPTGTVLEGETAYFKKGSDGKWQMSQDGENYDPVHYSHWFAASVCEAGHTDVILPKQAVPEEEEAPKSRSEPKRSSGESKKAIKSVLDRSGFWTRDNEMEDDFKEAGFDVLENNDEYIVVSDNKSDSDTQYQMRKFKGGSSFTLEPPTAISFGGEDDDDWDDEDDEEDW